MRFKKELFCTADAEPEPSPGQPPHQHTTRVPRHTQGLHQGEQHGHGHGHNLPINVLPEFPAVLKAYTKVAAWSWSWSQPLHQCTT